MVSLSVGITHMSANGLPHDVGPAVWDTPILTLLRLDSVPEITKVIPNVGVNVAFMWYGFIFLQFNIITRYAIYYLRLAV